MTGFISGSATALVTPFSKAGVDFDELGKLIEFQIESGTSALVVLGTTGEPATLSDEEKTEIIRYAVDKVKGRVKVLIGTGSNDTYKAVASSKRAQDLGADGVLCVTPYYNKCTQRGLVEYYKAICSSITLPVIAYNVPSRTGVNILPATAAEIAAIPNLAGIKEASGNIVQAAEVMHAIKGKCDLYSGEDAVNLPILALGGAGVISVVSNIAPVLVKKMCEYALANDIRAAVGIHEKLLPLTAACFTEVNPIPVKAALNLMGFKVGAPRSPLTEAEGPTKEILKNAMKEAGIL